MKYPQSRYGIKQEAPWPASHRRQVNNSAGTIVIKLLGDKSTLHRLVGEPIYHGGWEKLGEQHPPPIMSKLDPVVFRELPVIRKIIQDETWLEGERRGGYVSPEDPVVQENVCAIILSIGEKLREMFQGCDPMQTSPLMVSDHSEAA